MGIRTDQLSDEMHNEQILKNSLIARGNIKPGKLSKNERDLYNKLSLSDKEKNFDDLFGRIHTSRINSKLNINPNSREIYALNNLPDGKKRFLKNEDSLRASLIHRNKSPEHKFSIGLEPTALEVKAYNKIKKKIKPGEDRRLGFFASLRNLDQGQRNLYAKRILYDTLYLQKSLERVENSF